MASKYANCQFCEGSVGVKWHCQSCDIYLCDVCNTKIHTKLDKLSDHKVVILQHGENIEELENLRKVDLKDFVCSKHMDKKCVTYCLKCDKSLCSSCLIRPFQYEELNKVYEEKYLLLQNLKSKIDECYPFFEEKAADFRKMDDGKVAKHNEIKEKIFTRKNEVKDAVEKEALDLVEVMSGIWDLKNNPVSTERKRLSHIEQDVNIRKNRIDKALETQDPALVFSTVENISRDIPEKSALEIKPPDLIYIEPKEIYLKEVLGSIVRIPKVVPIQIFEVDFPEISGLVSLNDDICVMYNIGSRIFRYFTISGSKFVSMKDITDESKIESKNPKFNKVFFCRSFAKILGVTNYNGELLLSDDTFKMRRLKNNGAFENISLSFTADTLNFYGIHATKNNEVFVGFTNSVGLSAGILELEDIFHTSKMRRLECSSRSFKTLFTLPQKITTNINGYICVIDYLSAQRGRVVAIGNWGQPEWTYDGHPSINSEILFSPNDIVTTSSGLVLVAEKNTNAIHVLSKDGQFICNCISESEITKPISICFKEAGQLMIGCSDFRKPRLHMVKFIE